MPKDDMNPEMKTPQFDKALDEIFRGLVPHARTCKKCGQSFRVEKEDIDFYKMLRVPPPTLCPLCRKKRRFGHLMRAPKFFKRKCSVPGHVEEVISVYPPDSPHQTYDFTYYRSDGWDGVSYGVRMEPHAPFFSQFRDFFFKIPHVALERDPAGVGVDYTLGGRGGKNNYYCAMAYESEECSYCIDARFSRSMVDSNFVTHTSFGYELVGTEASNASRFLVQCTNCLESSFLYDCKNCSYCFMSANLRNRSYVFYGEQLTKEEYVNRMSNLHLGDRTVQNDCKNEFEKLLNHTLRRAVHTTNCVNSVGDHLEECRDCYFTFRSAKSERCRYCDNLLGTKDSMDCVNVLGERCYESVVAVPGNAFFSMYTRNSTFVEYCVECYDCSNCFGCVGLKNKQYHIFNTPYQENEYWGALDVLKANMLGRGEYGEFFDLSMGLMPYQSSSGQLYFPLTESEARAQNIPWYREPEPNIPEGIRLRDPQREVPSNVRDVPENVVNDALVCEKTGKPFRVVPDELQFYRKMNIPLPTKHPWERMVTRVGFEGGTVLYPFTCPRCGTATRAVYTPEEQKRLTVLCEPCYLKEVV